MSGNCLPFHFGRGIPSEIRRFPRALRAAAMSSFSRPLAYVEHSFRNLRISKTRTFRKKLERSTAVGEIARYPWPSSTKGVKVMSATVRRGSNRRTLMSVST
jgi:hypothetical protein